MPDEKRGRRRGLGGDPEQWTIPSAVAVTGRGLGGDPEHRVGGGGDGGCFILCLASQFSFLRFLEIDFRFLFHIYLILRIFVSTGYRFFSYQCNPV